MSSHSQTNIGHDSDLGGDSNQSAGRRGQDQSARLAKGLELARQEYFHPESETAEARPEQRSFCFTHAKITRCSVLLIHGFTACPFEMRELGQHLFNSGMNVFGLRLPGHGTSVTDFAKYRARDWEQAAVRGLEIASLLGNQVVVIGESMGGSLAAILANRHSESVHRLILCAPAFRFKNRLAYLAGWPPLQRWIPLNDMGVRYEWQFDYWYRAIPTSGVAELVRVARKGRIMGPGIQAPTLIIHALNDTIIDHRGSRNFYLSLSGLSDEQKQLILFDNGHHNLTINLNPRKAEVFDWIDRFLE